MPEKKKKKTNRAPAGAGSISQRSSDKLWQGSVTVGVNPGTGRPVKKYVYGKTQGEAQKKLDALKADIARGEYREPSGMTVGQWFDTWAEEYLGSVRPGTVESYKYHINHNIKPAIGAVRLQKLTPHHIQTFYNDLLRKRGLSPKTIKNLHGVIHKALKQATALGYVMRNPSDNLVLPRLEKSEMLYIEEDDFPRFLQAITGHKFEAIFFITAFTGLRRGEVVGLTWDCVDFERGTIFVNKQLVRNRGEGDSYIFGPTKNGKSHLITPAPAVMERLRLQQARQAEMREIAGPSWDNASNLVFTTPLGRFQSPHTVYEHYKKIMESLGMSDLRFHDLRHTYAVSALRSGDEIHDVSKNLDHYSVAFTMDVYGHITEKMQRESADRMERFIQSVAVPGESLSEVKK